MFDYSRLESHRLVRPHTNRSPVPATLERLAAAIDRPLRPYQLEPARAILDSVLNSRGLTIAVMMSRQAGKNELAAHLEALLLARHERVGGELVKAAPTESPGPPLSSAPRQDP